LDVKIEDLNDVGMAQAGDGAGFTLKPRQEFFLLHQVGAENFDGYEAVESGVVGFVNLRHASASDGFEQAIFAEHSPCQVGWLHEFSGVW